MQPFPILQERSKAPVAQFKWTVAVSAKRILLLAAHEKLNFDLQKIEKIQPADLQKLIEVSLADPS